MKVEPPRTAVDPLATVLAQIAAGRQPDPLAMLALRQILPASAINALLAGKPDALTTAPGLTPVAPVRQLDATENLQSRMPQLAAWNGATPDEYEPSAILRQQAAGDAPAPAPRPAAETPVIPHPVADRPPPAPPGPLELRKPVEKDAAGPPSRQARAKTAAKSARARAAKIWIMRGPIKWVGVSLLLTAVAFTFL